MKKIQTADRPAYSWSFYFALNLLAATIIFVGLIPAAHAAPEDGVIRAGSANIVEQGSTTLIQQSSQRAVIDWRGFSIQQNEDVRFAQPSVSSATLNRVTGNQESVILGRMDANGQVLLVNPNGIIFGKGAQINVGSLIASTSNLSNENFMQGKLVFDQPGQPGAGIINAGTITAAESGLVALVAPHVRNDGLIQARLGKVLLGAADTFTIDLYGDGLIKLALSDASLTRLKDAQGQPVKSLINQAGTIDVDGGQAVLVTAETAKGMLDSLINMSGTILADSAVQEGGRILLLARGSNADISGNLSARGTKGGQIEVLGDQVHLTSSAKLDADGVSGGGTLHVGGSYQGGSNTYRSQNTQIDDGAILSADALSRGNGGEVVVWSDGHTAYSGSISARGGAEGGDGGVVEVSGKQMLDFNGMVDAGASNGRAGSLLLDPYDFIIGMAEASLINRVLRTGTSTSVRADKDIYVNYVIDGRGRYAGGGLTLSAAKDININDYIVTNNGAINLYAGSGTVSLAQGKLVYAGTAPITVRSGSTLTNASYLTSGLLSLISTQGLVNINHGIDGSIGDLFIQAEEDVNINEPIVSLSDGNTVEVIAGNNIIINAQIDGRPALDSNPNGTVTMSAGKNIDLNKSILANLINLSANLGTINAPTMKAGTVTLDNNGIPMVEGLFSGTGPISLTTGGNLSSGIYVSTGPVSIRSTGGDVNVDTKLAEILGNVLIASDTGSVNVDQEIANIRSGSDLTIIAGNDINLNKQIDALDDTNPLSITPVPDGHVTLAAGNNVNLYKDLATYDGAVNVAATNGTFNIAWDNTNSRTYRIQSGSAPITVITGGNLSTGYAPLTAFEPPDIPDDVNETDYLKAYIADQLKPYVAFSTTGKLSLTSTGGDVTVDAPIPDTTGEIALTAADKIVVNHKVISHNQPITLTAGAGGIVVNSTDDTYGINGIGLSPAIDSGSSSLTLRALGDISVTTINGIAAGGKLTIDTRGKILQGTVFGYLYIPSEIELIADGGIDSFNARYSPKISATSSGGAINLEVFNPGQLVINAFSPTAGDVFTGGLIGQDVNIYAGRDINLSNVYEGGNLVLNAGRDANLNTFIIDSMNVTAVGNIYFSEVGLTALEPTVWLRGGDLIARSTGGDISFGILPDDYSAVHIGNAKNLTLAAYGSVTLGLLETLGPVSITARTGDITLRNDIGPPVQYYDSIDDIFYASYDQSLSEIYSGYDTGQPSFDPTGNGPASLLLDAGANIFMKGAKAAGTVTIIAGGTLTPTKGIYSGTTNGVSITANNGALIFTGTSFGDIPLDTQAQLKTPNNVAPAIMPGPRVDPPGLPGALTALPALPPDLVNVSGSGAPGASGANDSLSESEIEAMRAAGNAGLSEIIPDEDEKKDEEENNINILELAGGRGVGQTTDFGRE
ncbi:MAG: filamentous hemagglutinin N-terminal domain-containing protein [Proteobacteria bacterium]|nr:filamentous hemagglutinin N-terminal domain-containing protein [Pseudomonadota bacterium]